LDDESFAEFARKKIRGISLLYLIKRIQNNPFFIQRGDVASPKHEEMNRIVEHEMRNPENKALIFFRYRSELEDAMERYARYNPVGYHGKIRKNNKKEKINESGKTDHFKVDKEGNYLIGQNGRPIPTDKENGIPILALDYQLLVSEHDPKSRLILATYNTGTFGVNMPWINAVVFEDMPKSYLEEEQAGDRAVRIDPTRTKHEVRYYWMKAKYAQKDLEWLEKENPDLYNKKFKKGTYDEVQKKLLEWYAQAFKYVVDSPFGEGIFEHLIAQAERELSYFKFLEEEIDPPAAAPKSIPITFSIGILWGMGGYFITEHYLWIGLASWFLGSLTLLDLGLLLFGRFNSGAYELIHEFSGLDPPSKPWIVAENRKGQIVTANSTLLTGLHPLLQNTIAKREKHPLQKLGLFGDLIVHIIVDPFYLSVALLQLGIYKLRDWKSDRVYGALHGMGQELFYTGGLTIGFALMLSQVLNHALLPSLLYGSLFSLAWYVFVDHWNGGVKLFNGRLRPSQALPSHRAVNPYSLASAFKFSSVLSQDQLRVPESF